MEAAPLMDLRARLLDAVHDTASKWQRALAPFGYIPAGTEEVRRILAGMLRESIDLFLAEAYEPRAAIAIGERLAGLGYMKAEVMRATQQVLGEWLTVSQFGHPDPDAILRRQVGQVLIDITIGFFKKVETLILTEQEAIRAALQQNWEQAELARSEVESRNRAILQAQPDLVLIMGLDGVIHEAISNNPKRFAMPLDQVIGLNYANQMFNNQADRLMRQINTATQTGEMVMEQYVRPNEHPPDRFFEVRAVPFTSDQVLLFVRNKTEETLALQALEASEARFRGVVEDQSEFIVRWLPDGVQNFVNSAWGRFVGQPPEEMIGKSFWPYIYPEDIPTVQEHFKVLARLPVDDPMRVNLVRCINHAGKVRWLEWNNRVIFDAHGQIVEYQSVGRDITDLREAQEEMSRLNQLQEQMSRQLIAAAERERKALARELHDEILSRIGAMLIRLEDDHLQGRMEAGLQDVVDRLRMTIDGLRPATLNFGLWQALDGLYNDFIDRQEEVEIVMDIQGANVGLDPDMELHLYRIIQEAAGNALRHARASRIVLAGEIRPERVELRVEDDGIGFSPLEAADLPKALAGRHFGLANMIERGQLIGAQVRIDSSPGVGTRVSVVWENPNNPL
jgi:PAS domain S-box-containing protein